MLDVATANQKYVLSSKPDLMAFPFCHASDGMTYYPDTDAYKLV